jgi:molybdopterin converting factor small subunit
MSVTVDLTYDMGKALGIRSLEFESAATVQEVLRLTQERFQQQGVDFAGLSRVAAVAVNGVLTNYRRGRRTKLADGDTVAFVKAAAGG